MRSTNKYFSTVRVFTRHPTHRILKRAIKTNGKKVVLRLGSSTTGRTPADIEINTVAAVNNCSNKVLMKELFADAGVCSPEYYTYKDKDNVLFNNKVISIEELPYPILSKKTFRSRGTGMSKIGSIAEMRTFLRKTTYNTNNPFYFERFYNYTREYRIHTSSIEANSYFYSCRKMLKTDATKRWYRNNSNSLWYLEENNAFNKPVTWDAIITDCYKALTALKLDLCAFDVKVNKEGSWVILEGNSAPAFGTITAEKYLKQIKKFIT